MFKGVEVFIIPKDCSKSPKSFSLGLLFVGAILSFFIFLLYIVIGYYDLSHRNQELEEKVDIYTSINISYREENLALREVVKTIKNVKEDTTKLISYMSDQDLVELDLLVDGYYEDNPEISIMQYVYLIDYMFDDFESRLSDDIEELYEFKELAKYLPSIWPTVGIITSRFGYRKDPITGRRNFHKGIDISSSTGTPVYSTAKGTVKSIERSQGGLGNKVVIKHGDSGYTTIYGHLSTIEVGMEDSISRGEIIGRMGSTGRSTGTHLHYEVKFNGIHINPIDYMNRRVY